MQLHTVAKGSKVTLDHLFDAFRAMTREANTSTLMHGRVFTMSHPVTGMWFVYAHDVVTGAQLACAQFDQFDL
jgi:hypothetical protein